MKFPNPFSRRRPKAIKVDLSQRFDFIARLGTGSMSKVWRAVDRTTGRFVAVKVLDREKTLHYESRFSDRVKPKEGEIATQLVHPHIVRTFEHGLSIRDEQFLVMDLVEGIGLAYLVDTQNKVMQAHRLRIMIELGDAVEYLHQENWIHRDICPRNVLLDKEYSTKLIDVGLAVPNTKAFQEPGNRTGTANYMAPELIKRQRTDQRLDVFSFATTCYEMYCRELPWPSVTGASLEMVLRRINHRGRDLRELVPEIDPQIATAIMKGLEADPRDRWRSMSEMLSQLREAFERLHPPVKKQVQETPQKKSRKRRDAHSEKWQFRTQ